MRKLTLHQIQKFRIFLFVIIKKILKKLVKIKKKIYIIKLIMKIAY